MLTVVNKIETLALKRNDIQVTLEDLFCRMMQKTVDHTGSDNIFGTYHIFSRVGVSIVLTNLNSIIQYFFVLCVSCSSSGSIWILGNSV